MKLKYMLDIFRNDYDVVEAAKEQNSLSIQYASKKIKDKHKFVDLD